MATYRLPLVSTGAPAQPGDLLDADSHFEYRGIWWTSAGECFEAASHVVDGNFESASLAYYG